ncbi:hypothetical protein HMPREF1576_01039 [Gardnerella pickettii JCP7719]|uniref:Uncharacterized protein n=1 Tax=Gardnerella pickettii JCP7719 TaxID=1261061 RepID=S4H357_9BIFI|nr:hypothetical protein HMPREF1576_01039 [Gardnerella pickettii JCP7719]
MQSFCATHFVIVARISVGLVVCVIFAVAFLHLCCSCSVFVCKNARIRYNRTTCCRLCIFSGDYQTYSKIASKIKRRDT